jgi:ATP-dependent DNA helicase RecQ
MAMTDFRTARDVFGVASLKPEQRECISLLRSGKDVFAILRTGYGKSLCYQVPCVEMHGVALVVTPLLALALDQLHCLRVHGVHAIKFDSSVSLEDRAM